MKAALKIKGLLAGACTAGLVITCLGQAPPGWTNQPGAPGEGKWFINLNTRDAVAVRVIEKKIALRISDLERVLKAGLSVNKMKITSRMVPTEPRYPCIGFLGSTMGDRPAELYVIVTGEHVYSVYAVTFFSSVTPSKMGFSLADWQSAISADSRMAPGDHARYETVLKDIKSKLDSGRSLTGEN